MRSIFETRASVILFFIMTFYFNTLAASCEALTAGKVEINGLYSIGEEEFTDLFGVRTGSIIDKDRITNGIKRVFLKGIFEDISVRLSDGEYPLLKIDVRERDFIRKIYVKGDPRIPEKRIKELFILKEGQVMRYDLIPTAVSELKERLSKYGFPDAKITADIERTDRRYGVNIYLTVNTGVPLVIKHLKFNIVPPYPYQTKWEETGFFSDIKISIGDIYDQYKLENDLSRIKAYFKRSGYYRPVVGPYTFRDGDLEIVLNPGRHMNVAIEGNSSISEKLLLKEAPFFEIEDFNDEVVGEAIDRMLALYHREGYPFTQIAPVINSDERDVDIAFFIFEGEKIKTRSIRFNNAGLPHNKLKEVMSLKENAAYNPDLIGPDRESLKEFYAALGYLEANIRDIEVKIDRLSGTSEITVDIEEGRNTEIISVEITGAAPEIRDKLMSVVGVNPGDPYNEVDISDARFRILEYYGSLGYPNIDVVITRNVDNHMASINFNVIEGDKRLFGSTVITGNKKTRYEVIKRELIHKEGRPYSFAVLSEERQKLYKLGLFTDVEIDAIEGAGAGRDIVIKVNEANAGSVEFGFGYAEREKFRSFIELNYRNLWGMNRQGSLRTELSSFEKRYILQYNEPWFMGRPLPLRIFFLHEDKREINTASKETLFKLNRYTVLAGVEKKISNTMKSELYYEFSLVRTSEVQPDVVLSKEDTGALAISALKPAIIYDTRDNPFDPRKGILAGISLKTASFLFFSETNFTKLEIYGSDFHRLSRRMTLATSLRGGVSYGYAKTDQLPIVERFFLGGRSTVRGYDQDSLGPKGSDGNPTGGNAFFMGNIELRTSIGKGLGLVPFFDFGNVWIKANDIDPADLKFTTGIGLRYNTPVGPLRVDYGIKLNREAGEGRGEIHFSIGHAF